MTRELPIKRLADISLGKMLQSEPKSPSDILLNYLRAANVQPDGELAIADAKTMWFTEDEVAVLDVRAGDVVVVEGGFGGFGRAAFVAEDLVGWGYQNSINRARPRSGTDGRFLTYALLSLRATGWIRAYCNIVSMPHLTAEKLSELKVPAPPLDAQRERADFLDRETARIDGVLSEQIALLTALGERRRALVTHSILGRGGVSTRLKRVSTTQTGLTLGKETDDGTEVPYLRVANVQAGSLALDEIKTVRVTPGEQHRHSLRPGDVLMTEGGDLDKLGRGAVWDGSIEPCLHQNHVFAVRCSTSLDRKFLTYWMESQPARQYFRDNAKKTTNLAAINSTILGNLPIELPGIEIQRLIVAELDRATSQIDRLTDECRALVTLLKERRAALVTAAVTGQIDVRDA